MSINYTTLFTELGKVIKVSNDLITLQNTYRGIGSQADAIGDAFGDRRDLTVGLVSSFDGIASQMASQVGTLKSVADKTMADLQKDLNAADGSPDTILPRLYEDMVANSQTVNASTVSNPSIAAISGNTGDGSLIGSKVDNLGRDAEISFAEIVRFACTSDQYGGGVAGGEEFSVIGYPTIDATTYGTRGNGRGDSISVMNNSGANFLTNGGFDTFTVTDTPDSWTRDAGTISTNIFQSTATYHSPSASSLKLQGNSSVATVTLSQSVQTSVSPLTRYVAACFARKGAGTFASGSTLTIRVTDGTNNYTLFSADPTTLTTSFVIKSAFFNMGETIPATLKFEITWTTVGGVASTGQIFIDDCCVAQAYEFGGTYYGLFRGAADFTVADAYTSTTANSEGVIQGYFSRFYGVQLPSDAVGGESIVDSLAT